MIRGALALTLLVACASSRAPAPAPTTAITTAPATTTATASATESASAYDDALALARAARDKAAGVALPAFTGDRTAARVKQYAASTLTPWLRDELAILKVAEDHYAAAFAAGGPSQKVVAASEYLAMLARVLDAVAAVPMPKEWESDPDAARAFTEALSGVTAPYRARGRAIAAKCTEASRSDPAANTAWKACSEFPAKYPP